MADATTNSAQRCLQEIHENIQKCMRDASTPLDVRTFDEAELILPRAIQPTDRVRTIGALAELLPNLQQDATPAVNLILRLVEDFTYTDIMKLGPLQYTAGLAVGEYMAPFNRLILTLLGKATKKPSDAAHVASMLDTMLAVVRLWLCTNDTGIAMQSSKLLLDLLKVDQEIQSDPIGNPCEGGQGLVWKRIFGDRNIYGTFFEVCSLSGPSSLSLSKSQRTLAQARLMECLPAVGAMDWSVLVRSHHSDIEALYDAPEGLLDFAALRMVDYQDDVLMRRCLIDFYSDLLHTTRLTDPSAAMPVDSAALRYMITKGLHARTTAMYLQLPGTQLDPVESMFLYGPAANYIATYASDYPDHFLASQMPKQVTERLAKTLDISPAKWAHAESPKHDLHVVASLPRKALLPDSAAIAQWSSSPVSLLPSRSTNPDVLNTLATLFHGPYANVVYPPTTQVASNSASFGSETSSARVLYFHYLANNPRFWQDIIRHADTVALKDLALAAIGCLIAVITANWSCETVTALPTTIATPDQGHVAILSPPALEYVLPYLLKPAQSFANLVGGRGDAESAAYKIANAKFDALKALHSKLMAQAERQPGQGYEDILATLSKKLAEGPMSRNDEVGGRVGTLDL